MGTTRVGGTGHRLLPAPTARLVDRALRRRLAGHARAAGALVGVTSLADGADLLFAEAILALGGTLEVVLPAARYRELLPVDALGAFDRLLARAGQVRCLTFPDSTSEAHMAAGQALVDAVDLLIAVWDGRPARGFGGTGDVVAYARERGVPVEVVWPPGAFRD
ncbi:MAG TPA: hypothetical protein VIC57_00880 [Candidatus Dormibacteraeota bacterium]|jgi:hypothetical protein